MIDVPAFETLKPGDTIGILGGGQLARMLAVAAARLGLKTIVLDPDKNCPAAAMANAIIVADYDDVAALEELSKRVSVITYEFENVPYGPLDNADLSCSVEPGTQALAIAQDRILEKDFFNSIGIPTAPYRQVATIGDAEAAFSEFGPGILKTCRLGYDGKGQARISTRADCGAAFAAMNGAMAIYEGFIAFEREVSVIAARFYDGAFTAFDVPENVHQGGILRTSTVPARLLETTENQAKAHAETLLAALGYVGVAGVEFFVMGDGSLIANEFAPRVHNSGHWTEAACAISQFEQHIRAIAGLAPGDTGRHSSCIMHNLIGDDVLELPRWLATKQAHIHLYGKTDVRPGRKMGHVTVLS
ncbi:MAG: 5-(carboxyamino)imidazole ribonucleotide synthase [Notoacmeibacter sp.]